MKRLAIPLGLLITCFLLASCTEETYYEEIIIEGDGASVEIQAGVQYDDADLGVAAVDPPLALPQYYTAVGDVFAFTPHGTEFSHHVTLRIPYSSTSNDLLLFKLDNDADVEWNIINGTTFVDGIASVTVNSFSYYVVMVENGGGDDDDSGDDDSAGDDDDTGDDDSAQES